MNLLEKNQLQLYELAIDDSVDLAIRYECCRLLKERNHYNPHLGDIDIFLQENKGMVYEIAIKYSRKTRLPVEVADLRQEGFIGLIKAYQYFDPSKGALSTIAYFWIRNEIIKYIRDKLPLVRPPKRSYELAGKIIMNRMSDSDPAEVAKHFDTTLDAAQRALWRIQNGTILSINEKLFDGQHEVEYWELFFLEDDQSEIEVEQFLEKLSELQRRVIGLLMNGFTKADVARELGLSRSRIGAVVQSVKERYLRSGGRSTYAS